MGTANEQYASYTIERLEVSVSSLRSLINHMEIEAENGLFDEEESIVITEYKNDLTSYTNHTFANFNQPMERVYG